MKTLEQLGISPAPWDCALTETAAWVEEAHGLSVANMDTDETPDLDQAHANARLISAAPELYEALREAVEERCGNCDGREYRPEYCLGCHVLNWKAALEKAKGGAE